MITLALVTACGGDGDGDVEPVEAAQARVTAAEASVADAQTALVEANAERPASISNSTAPNEKMSERPSIGSPRHCSGDM